MGYLVQGRPFPARDGPPEADSDLDPALVNAVGGRPEVERAALQLLRD